MSESRPEPLVFMVPRSVEPIIQAVIRTFEGTLGPDLVGIAFCCVMQEILLSEVSPAEQEDLLLRCRQSIQLLANSYDGAWSMAVLAIVMLRAALDFNQAMQQGEGAGNNHEWEGKGAGEGETLQ